MKAAERREHLAEIIHLYKVKHLTLREIASKVRITHQAVSDRLKRAGVETKGYDSMIRRIDRETLLELEEVGSGAKARRMLEERLIMARRREIDAILVWMPDRFGRSLADLIAALNFLRELDFVSVSLRNR